MRWEGINMISARNYYIAVFAVLWSYVGSATEVARGVGCEKCGRQENVQCVCRPIYTTKFIEITCWDSVCEDVCLPPRTRCKEGCPFCKDTNNSPQGENGTTDAGKAMKIRSCNKLVRKTYLQPIPTVVWVVDHLCPSCRYAEHAFSMQDSTIGQSMISDMR